MVMQEGSWLCTSTVLAGLQSEDMTHAHVNAGAYIACSWHAGA